MEIPEEIKTIISTLESSGFDAYVVGGSVRDALLSLPVNDWDVCTSAEPEDMISSLCDFKVIETGIKHGTVTAVLNDIVCEITTFRFEGRYSDHRHPDSVSFTTNLADDLKRRDFTINAMAYSPDGSLIDLFDGANDLKRRLIRCVGSPEKRFREDALRILRALRFSSCLGFEVEAETKKAIFENYKLLSFVAKERVVSELRRLLCGRDVCKVVSDFKPVFDFIFETEISLFPTEYEICKKSLYLSLAYLLSFLDSENSVTLLKKLKFDNKTITKTALLLSNKLLTLRCKEAEVLSLLSKFGKDNVYMLADFLLKDESEKFKLFVSKLPVITLRELAINGDDLISCGIPEGKHIKFFLEAALNAVLNGECENKKDSLCNYIIKKARKQ